jgi:hypothetical protein
MFVMPPQSDAMPVSPGDQPLILAFFPRGRRVRTSSPLRERIEVRVI